MCECHVPFRCLVERGELAVAHRFESLAQEIDGLDLVQTCWRICFLFVSRMSRMGFQVGRLDFGLIETLK